MNVKLPGSTLPPPAPAGKLQSSARSAQAFGFRRDAAQTLRFDDDLSRAGRAVARQPRRVEAATTEVPPVKPARAEPKRRAEESPASDETSSTIAGEVAANQPVRSPIESATSPESEAGAEIEPAAAEVVVADHPSVIPTVAAPETSAVLEQGETELSNDDESQAIASLPEELAKQVAATAAEGSQQASAAGLAEAAGSQPTRDAGQTSAVAAAVQQAVAAAAPDAGTGRSSRISADAPRIDVEGSNNESTAGDAIRPEPASGSSLASVEVSGAALRVESAPQSDAEPQANSVASVSPGASQHGAATSPAASDAAALAAGQPQGTGESKSATPAFAQVLPQPGTSLRDDENVGRIARGLQSAVNQRGGAVTLRLNPPELGALRIDMVVRDGVVTARFTAEHESVRNLLMDQMSHLRQGLDRQGLAVDRLEVKSPDSSAAWMQQRGGEGAGHDGRSAGHEDASQKQQAQHARRLRDGPARTFADVVSLGEQGRRGT